MSNDFFNFSAGQFLARVTVVKASVLNSFFQSIADGFDLLPGKDALNFNKVTYYVAAGTANTYTVTMAPAPVAYSDGMHLRLKIPASNTGASTLDVNGLGVRSIRRFDRLPVESGDLTSGDVADIVFEGSYWVMQTPSRSLIDVVQAAQYASNASDSADAAAESAAAALASENAADASAVAAAASVALAAPPGAVMAFAANSAPTGWLECAGTAVSRTTYADLFSAIGTTFGVGDGSTTFNLPDMRGEFMRGWDNGRGVDGSRVFGSAQLDQMQRITGNIQIRSIDTGSDPVYNDAGAMNVNGSGATGQPTIKGDSTTRTRNKINFDSADSPNARASSSTSGETRARNVAMMYIIKT